MNILPFDYTRCHGAQHPLCERCASRQPGRSYWQSYFAEPLLDTQSRRAFQANRTRRLLIRGALVRVQVRSPSPTLDSARLAAMRALSVFGRPMSNS